ncbi:MAG: helix-turn-helix transcriptional regulator [Schwartzia sp.]|nr:helix-turn-helix transcriptional regulator [Schwartzia sp. (in: firmicutes)]
MPMRLFGAETLLFSYLIFIYMVMQSPTTGAFLPGLSLTGPLMAAVNILFFSCTAAGGMLVFAFLGRTTAFAGRRATGAIFALGVAGRLLMEAAAGRPGLYTVALFFVMVSCGYLVGLVSCRVATEVAPAYFGRFIGCAHGLAATLQFVLSTMDTGSAALPLIHAASFLTLGALGWLLFFGASPAPKARSQLAASPLCWRRVFPQGLPLILAGLAFVSLLQGFGDVLAVLHHDEYESVFGWTRLAYAVGLFFFGWLADVHFFSLPVAMIFAKSYFFWYHLSEDQRTIFPLLSCFDELLQASFVVLLSASFLHIAARSDRPERWASTGRMVELPLMGVGLCAGVAIQPHVSLSLMLAIYMTLLLLAIYMAYRVGMLYIRALQAETESDGAADAGGALRIPATMSGMALAATPVTGSMGAVPFTAMDGAVTDAGRTEEKATNAEAFAQPPETTGTDIDPDAGAETAANETNTKVAGTDTTLPTDLRSKNAVFDEYCKAYALTARESEVLAEMLHGKSAPEIAESLYIAERTVRFHVANLLKKTKKGSQLELVSTLMQEIIQGTHP